MKKEGITLLLGLIVSVMACNGSNNDDLNYNPTVLFSMIFDEVTCSSSVSCAVEVSCNDAGAIVFTERGLCFSDNNKNPDLNDEILICPSGSGSESFKLELTGLKEETTYYVRPYIKAGDSIFYGYVKSFKTLGTSADYYPAAENEEISGYDGYNLKWSDEFNINGEPSDDWNYETGFVRNEELQWYQANNAVVESGCLVISGKKERVNNSGYVAGSSNWKENRIVAEYTSASLTTSKSHIFKYGRFVVRAKIPVAMGAWPAIWTLGNKWEWPLCGEIDMLEYYIRDNTPIILANACWGSNYRWNAIWDESTKPLSDFTGKDSNWTDKFHVWRMDWDENYIRLYLDDELMNEINIKNTINGGWDNNNENPFSNTIADFGHYMILNLALGGHGGTPDDSAFPLRYKIDYVRVYKKTE